MEISDADFLPLPLVVPLPKTEDILGSVGPICASCRSMLFREKPLFLLGSSPSFPPNKTALRRVNNPFFRALGKTCFWNSWVRSLVFASCDSTGILNDIPSGNLTYYWKWQFVVDLPIENCDFPSFFVCLPEGKWYKYGNHSEPTVFACSMPIFSQPLPRRIEHLPAIFGFFLVWTDPYPPWYHCNIL